MSPQAADREFLEPGSVGEWRAWLAQNHDSSRGVWLAIGKKGGTATTLTYEEAVQEAVAFGWIDSTVRRVDSHRFKQLFTPRRPGSDWAPSNKRRVEQLSAEGRMHPAGLAVVEAARADGSWNRLDDIESLVVPTDLAEALAADERTARAFELLPDSEKKQLLYWIASAKRPETRARRVLSTIETASAGELPRPR